MRVALGLVSLLAAAGCGDDAGTAPRDAGAVRRDAAETRDAARPDDARVSVDAAGPTADAGPPPPERWFDDVTFAAGVAFERTGIDAYTTLPDRMSGGVCVIDVDGVRPYDLFFALRGESHLFVASAPTAYADETFARGLGEVGDAMGCLALDADADGDQDLLVTAVGALRLFRNDAGVFVDASARLALGVPPHHMLMGASAGDLDGDGDLDLVVSGFLDFDPARHPADESCGPSACVATLQAYPFVADHVLEQGADGVFRDVTAARAPDLLAREPGLVSVIRDLDEDGAPDIYVGNDLGYSFVDRVLVRDAGGTFVDVGPEIGLARSFREYGIDTMGFASGDVNGDGHLDHVVTSFESDPTAVFVWQDESARYEDWSLPLGTVALSNTFRWGAALVDVDLDGDLDLFEATGHFHTADEIERIGYVGAREQRPNLMVNLGDGTLRQVLAAPGDGMDVLRASRGLAITDLDDDGRPDVVLAPALGPPALLLNVRPAIGHFLRVALEGRAPNTGAIGARVTVRSGGTERIRERILGEGYLGCSDPRLFFGLPDGAPADVTVRWPSGAITTRTDVAVDGEIAIAEP